MPKHFLSLQDLSPKILSQLLRRAELFQKDRIGSSTCLKDKWIAHLFFEPSTRTRCSFEIAAKKLGAEVLNFDTQTSSIQKGEEILDTLKTLEAMGCDVAVVRHSQDGMIHSIANQLEKMCVINAGDGQNEHPSQALLDMLTIRQHKPDFSKLSVAIVGDIAHSRVARSDIFALQMLGTTDIRAIAPSSLLPTDLQTFNVQVFHDLKQGLQDVDVIIALRMQKERIAEKENIDVEMIRRHYMIATEILSAAKKEVIVMHPGPLNRGIEISSEVADGPHSVILQQVSNGVFARMAIFDYLLNYNENDVSW
jgi:aspartate carbamoyltransferase catalytic subunit